MVITSLVIRLPLQSLRGKFRVSEFKSSGKRFKVTTKSGRENLSNESSQSGRNKKSQKSNLPVWQRLGPLSSAIAVYARCQGKRPYLTQFVTSLVIYFIGDFSAQKINGGPYDPYLMIRTLIISAGSSIPTYEW
ncbi:hypothetical protein EPUL_002876 [Erysiphe pulchra]|uniref:Uncharacterized protein n=1 Tax=Erysiphe pulchra TaxID=225359 RepID=A0A2S4PSR7_9PEZI|nr:hypothetical protein EPUL_002876 [Erysiphe pulchra]